MRSAKENNFPYKATQICYIALDNKGEISQITNKKTSLTQAYQRAKSGEIIIYAVWPGQYTSDLFIIDDLEQLADKVGISRG